MPMTCPRDGGEMIEIERSGVRIDACRTCRGVFLDRGELDKVLEHQREAFAQTDQDDEEFLREVTGASGGGDRDRGRDDDDRDDRDRPKQGFDRETAERMFREYRGHKQHQKGKKKKSLLDDFFD